MTSSTILPVITGSPEAIDALATSARAPRGVGAGPTDAQPFDAVLATEAASTRHADAGAARRDASGPDAPDDWHEPRTDPQPARGRDDDHAAGRTHERRDASAARPRDADDASDDAAIAARADTAAPSTGAPATDRQGATDEGAKGPAGEHDVDARALDTTTATPADPSAVLAAAISPAIAADTANAQAKAADDTATPRNPKAATPAIPAIPAVPAAPGKARRADGATAATPAIPATPAVPAVPAGRGAGIAPTRPDGVAQPVPTDASSAPGRAPKAPDAAEPVAPPATSTAASAAPTGPAAEQADASTVTAAAIAPVDRPGSAAGRRPPPAMQKPSASAARTAVSGDGETPGARVDGETPGARVDAARARASIAGIVAAGASDADARPAGHTADRAAPSQSSSPSATSAAVPAADPGLAVASVPQGAASRGVASGASSAVSAPAASAAPSAVDRVALQAIDRIRATATGGVPGLESRIDDPELGTIRVVVSARVGETIRAEIVARDPAAARELASGIDRAMAAGAVLPGNLDLRVRAESAAPTARADAHLADTGGHAGRHDQATAGAGFGAPPSGSDSPRGGHADRGPEPRAAAAPAGHPRAIAPHAVTAPTAPRSARPGAVDLRA